MSAALFYRRATPSVLPSMRRQVKLTVAPSYRTLATASEPKTDPLTPGTPPPPRSGSSVFPWIVGAIFLGGGYWVGSFRSILDFNMTLGLGLVLHSRGAYIQEAEGRKGHGAVDSRHQGLIREGYRKGSGQCSSRL